MNKKFLKVAFLLLALLGLLSVLLATPWGIGASPDSVVYISGARSLAAGYGFTQLSGTGEYAAITHHAPLYSALLSISGFFSAEPEQTARFLNALLFSANIFMLGLLASAFSRASSPTAWIIPTAGAFLLLISPLMLEIHLMAWTEPLFIFLILIFLGLLSSYLKKSHWIFLVGSAAAAGLAFLTRYAGLSIILTGMLGIFLYLPGSLLKRIRGVAVFGTVSLLPVFFWLARNFLTAGNAANREFAFHPVSKTQLWVGLTTISGWFGVPDAAPTYLKLFPLAAVGLGFLALLTLAVWVGRKKENQSYPDTGIQLPEFIKLVLLFVPVYLLFLLLSISFFDANTPLDNRILSPVYVSGLLLALFAFSVLISSSRKYLPITISVLVLGLWLSMNYTFVSVNLVADSYRSGIGLNSVVWHESETLKELYKYPEEMVIFTNAPDAIILQVGRPAVSLPRKYESAVQRENHHYASEMAVMKSQVDNNQALIVYFFSLTRPNITTVEELRRDLRLDTLALLSDGTIFGTAKSAGLP